MSGRAARRYPLFVVIFRISKTLVGIPRDVSLRSSRNSRSGKLPVEMPRNENFGVTSSFGILILTTNRGYPAQEELRGARRASRRHVRRRRATVRRRSERAYVAPSVARLRTSRRAMEDRQRGSEEEDDDPALLGGWSTSVTHPRARKRGKKKTRNSRRAAGARGPAATGRPPCDPPPSRRSNKSARGYRERPPRVFCSGVAALRGGCLRANECACHLFGAVRLT